MARYTQEDKDRARQQLLVWLKPGATVYTVLRHVSRSGMSRSIDAFVIAPGDSAPTNITYQVAAVLGESLDGKHGGIRMGGCGMDMGFALVYNLSSVLYPQGFGCIGENRDAPRNSCPSNDHSNGDRSYAIHHEPHGLGRCPDCGHHGSDCEGAKHWHTSGGYALRHRWM